MKENVLFLFILSFFFLNENKAQRTPIEVVEAFSQAKMRLDTAELNQFLHPNASVAAVYPVAGTIRYKIEVLPKAAYLGFMGLMKKKRFLFKELLSAPIVTYLSPISVLLKVDFKHFDKGNTLQQCGSYAYSLVKEDSGKWLLLSVLENRRNTNCAVDGAEDSLAVNKLMDAWHRAATKADENAFFGAMDSTCIYLGTDATERWLRDELKTTFAFAFERETAWDFTPSKRQLYFSEDGNTVWLEEMLATQMGTCRGSAVLKRVKKEWKIVHYDLAIMVPNELVNDFKALVNKGPSRKRRKRKKR
jgi:hypothetical protein